MPDDALFRYAGELAMGLALLRARYLDADVRQLAVWDGKPDLGDAGTAFDVATWRATRRAVSVIPTGTSVPANPATAGGAAGSRGRVVRALIFADVKGFSKLADEQVPLVLQHVLSAFATRARALRRRRSSIATRGETRSTSSSPTRCWPRNAPWSCSKRSPPSTCET